jgi:hypothetical protein
MGKRILVLAIATLLWLVSAVLGMIAMLQVYEATRVVAAFVIPVDPLQTTAHGPQVVFVARVALIILAIGWLSGAILLFEQYHDAAGERRRLARMFLITTIVELVVIGLATAIIYVLPGLTLGVTPQVVQTSGEHVWPNTSVGETYQEEVEFLKEWLTERLTWMDANIREGTFVRGKSGAYVPMDEGD